MKRKKLKKRRTIESIYRAVYSLAKVQRGLIAAQRINTDKLNELLGRKS